MSMQAALLSKSKWVSLLKPLPSHHSAVILVSCLQHELILPKLATKILNSNWLCGVSRVNSKDTRPFKGDLFLLTIQGVNWATDMPAFFQEV